MDSSKLKWSIAFDKRTVASDGYGNERAGFTEQFVVHAHLRPRFGGEAVQAARLEGHQPVTITVRQSDQTRTIREDWRARDARTGEIYAITAPPIDPDGARQWIEILTRTGVAA